MDFGMDAGTILVVEDDPNDQQLLMRAAQKSGIPCKVFVADSATKALDFLFRRGEFEGATHAAPTAIFLDLNLPGMGGLELISRLRAPGMGYHSALIVYTGSSNQRDVVACYAAGANSVLQKVEDYDLLMANIGEAIRYWLTINRTPNSFLKPRSNPYVN